MSTEHRPATRTAIIRPERPEDAEAIHALTQEAFKGKPFSSGTEAAIVRSLRASGGLALSLVADSSGTIIGHVAFSPVGVTGSPGDWFGLGPISVKPEHQGGGIGRRLVRCGLELLQQQGAEGCALIGDPDIYCRLGFRSGGLLYRGLDEALVQYVVLNGAPSPAGTLTFLPAFDDE
ncbi:GNAT family N-acetyltransferase [Arthrobacter sp. MDT2-2]